MVCKCLMLVVVVCWVFVDVGNLVCVGGWCSLCVVFCSLVADHCVL